jgi:RNA polymerase sigma-70 factor, ECF subfamily
MPRPRLADLLRAPHSLRCGDDPAHLERALQGVIDRARARFSGVSLLAEEFVARLARALPPGVTASAGLEQLNTDELYLACACAHGEGAAIALLEQRCFGKAEAALRRMNPPAPLMDEWRQRLRQALFVAERGRRPKIDQYTGREDLGGWIRTLAVRLALELIEPAREVATPDDALPALGPLTGVRRSRSSSPNTGAPSRSP